VQAAERLFRERWVSHEFEGVRLKVLIADPVAAEWYDRGGWKEREETRFMKANGLGPGATVFDIGAHQCVVASIYGKLVGPAGKVVAIEASDINCERARRNLEANQVPQVELVHAAIAAENGRVRFTRNFNGQVDDGKGTLGAYEVEAVTLDELASRHGRPAIVVIDVEGYECEALKGAHGLLGGSSGGKPPAFFIEVHSFEDLSRFGGSVATVLSCFDPARYELLAGDSLEFKAFKPIDEQVRSTRKPFSLLARPL
jgi:FkbM family methyltransferase